MHPPPAAPGVAAGPAGTPATTPAACAVLFRTWTANPSAWNYSLVQNDPIGDLAGEFAAQLNVPPPEIKRGRVPAWVPAGLRMRPRRGRPVLIISPRFEAQNPVEQEAQLAYTLTIYSSYPRLRRRVVSVLVVYLIAPFILGPLAADAPGWIWIAGFVVLTLGFVLAWIMLLRWFVYKTECKVAEVFGWPVVDAMLDFDREHPVKGVGLQPAFYRVACPSVDRRMVRLESVQRADRSDSPPGRLTG